MIPAAAFQRRVSHFATGIFIIANCTPLSSKREPIVQNAKIKQNTSSGAQVSNSSNNNW